jgi:hypothetical protein
VPTKFRQREETCNSYRNLRANRHDLISFEQRNTKTMSAITKLLHVLPHMELDKIAVNAQPTAHEVRHLQQQVFSNSISVASEHGGGDHGHLGTVMEDAEYLTVSTGGVAWAAPGDPVFPIFLADATPGVVTTQLEAYKVLQAEKRTMANLEDQQRTQIHAAVPAIYLNALASRRLGFVGVTAKMMLAHLAAYYGTITADDLDDNLERAKSPWNPNHPIEEVFEKILAALDFAAAGEDPITEAAAVRIAVKIFEDSGVMDDAVKDWRKAPVAERIWGNIQPFFHLANKERLRIVTANELGFANATQGQQPTQGQRPTEEAAPPTTNATNNSTGGNTGIYYCWTHGMTFNAAHTSATCAHKNEGHKDTATLRNMLGGTNKIPRKRNERAYVPATTQG